MPEQITLYTAKLCPYAQRVEMALKETRTEYTRYEIDLLNKPAWYAREVNSASKVPALTYGGPVVSPDQPSPASTKLTESLILVEFIADLHPSSTIMPPDVVGRAKARFFVDMVTTKFMPAWYGVFGRKKNEGVLDGVMKAIEMLQETLSGESEYAMGKAFTIADICVAPMLVGMWLALEKDFGAYEVGEGRKVYEKLRSGEKYERIRRYVDKIRERESFKSTFDELEYVTEVGKKWINRQ